MRKVEKKMELLFDEKSITEALQKIYLDIKVYLSSINEEVHFITILKEGIHFSVDLSKKLYDYDLIFDYIFLKNVNPDNRELAIEKDIFLPVKNRKVIVCSVLTRTGYELSFIENYLKIRGASEIKTVSLICKQETHKKPDFYFFEIPNDYYLVGYGLGYNERYRNLQKIYRLII
ncbi:MAG: phosphoribosyltransferase family protein [Candidatus Calescibacterium sp.]|nr:phosphoribosyltransferase family protein [Candidatus Calescibacterium sp.]MCX7971847.1 phosphoribosyltransferase family protein [bacterium]MDW8195054.1 phosphoribosyltransferase family protein [Candidatus Calescibacterium sp.]